MKVLGLRWQLAVGGLLIYIGVLGLLCYGLNQLPPHYDYRLVTPTEAMRLVNDDGWRVSERIRMTDQAVYVYREHTK